MGSATEVTLGPYELKLNLLPDFWTAVGTINKLLEAHTFPTMQRSQKISGQGNDVNFGPEWNIMPICWLSRPQQTKGPVNMQ